MNFYLGEIDAENIRQLGSDFYPVIADAPSSLQKSVE